MVDGEATVGARLTTPPAVLDRAIRADERERCAQVAEGHFDGAFASDPEIDTADGIARAIRALDAEETPPTVAAANAAAERFWAGMDASAGRRRKRGAA